MAHYVETANGSLIARIDNISASGLRRVLVDHHGGGAGNELFEVYESGSIKLYGRLHRTAPVQLNNIQAGNSSSSKPTVSSCARSTAPEEVTFQTEG